MGCSRYRNLFVQARNKKITKKLTTQYQEYVQARCLNMFFIGNKDYEGIDYMGEQARELAVEGSGIPELRRYCHTIVGKAQFRASSHFLDVQISGLVQSLEVWVEASQNDDLPAIPQDCISDLRDVSFALAAV